MNNGGLTARPPPPAIIFQRPVCRRARSMKKLRISQPFQASSMRAWRVEVVLTLADRDRSRIFCWIRLTSLAPLWYPIWCRIIGRFDGTTATWLVLPVLNFAWAVRQTNPWLIGCSTYPCPDDWTTTNAACMWLGWVHGETMQYEPCSLPLGMCYQMHACIHFSHLTLRSRHSFSLDLKINNRNG